jgi:hypothetical protein
VPAVSRDLEARSGKANFGSTNFFVYKTEMEATAIVQFLEQLGFEIQQSSRILLAVKRVEKDDTISVFVDTVAHFFKLKYTTEFASEYLIREQGYLNDSDLQAMLLKNRVFIHYQLGSPV